MGIDPTGVRSVMEIRPPRQGKELALRAGFNMRFEPAYQKRCNAFTAVKSATSSPSTPHCLGNRLTRFSG